VNFTVEISNVPDRDDVVAEVWRGDAMVEELHRGADENVEIEIYPPESDDPWRFDLVGWLAVLAEAQRKLGWSA
jgi:hypothetical protein